MAERLCIQKAEIFARINRQSSDYFRMNLTSYLQLQKTYYGLANNPVNKVSQRRASNDIKRQ
jgi:hypothetical protein